MKIEDQIPILKKVLAFKTPEEQRAFLEGLECQMPLSATEKPPETPVVVPTTEKPIVVETNANSHRKVVSRGLRAKVLRLLYTGPCREAELAGHCKPEEAHALRSTLRKLQYSGSIAESNGMFVLTTLGRPEARFFIDHPTVIVHNRQSDKGLSRLAGG